MKLLLVFCSHVYLSLVCLQDTKPFKSHRPKTPFYKCQGYERDQFFLSICFPESSDNAPLATEQSLPSSKPVEPSEILGVAPPDQLPAAGGAKAEPATEDKPPSPTMEEEEFSTPPSEPAENDIYELSEEDLANMNPFSCEFLS